MNKLFSTLLSSLKAKVQPLVTKLRFLTTPAFWTTTIFTKIRQFFTKLLDIKPKHKKDYYTIGRWLVSKRLAFAMVVALGVVCAIFISINLPHKTVEGASAFPTYKYNAIPLKFKEETVNILAHDGHLAYTGQVKKGEVIGEGTLFYPEGAKLYEGSFAGDKFNGKGQTYYPQGGLCYAGDFVDNLFQGKGSFYHPTGTVEYMGDYLAGLRSGQGELYNASGAKIFTGTFLNDNIVYNELAGKPTKDLAEMYSGKTSVYSTNNEYCVAMDEINALYSAKDGSATLTGEWQVDAIFVLDGLATIGNTSYKSIAEIMKALGKPDYFGTAWINLPEAICINRLAEKDPEAVSPVSVKTGSAIEGVYTVSGYDSNATIYLYTFINEGLLYTFYCNGETDDSFIMYSIKPAA